MTLHVPDGTGALRAVTRTPPPAGDGTGWHVDQLAAVVAYGSGQLLPLAVTHGGVDVDGLAVAVSPSRTPQDRQWRPLEEGGVRVPRLPPGRYVVAVRHPSGAVLDAGRITIT